MGAGLSLTSRPRYWPAAWLRGALGLLLWKQELQMDAVQVWAPWRHSRSQSWSSNKCYWPVLGLSLPFVCLFPDRQTIHYTGENDPERVWILDEAASAMEASSFKLTWRRIAAALHSPQSFTLYCGFAKHPATDIIIQKISIWKRVDLDTNLTLYKKFNSR